MYTIVFYMCFSLSPPLKPTRPRACCFSKLLLTETADQSFYYSFFFIILVKRRLLIAVHPPLSPQCKQAIIMCMHLPLSAGGWAGRSWHYQQRCHLIIHPCSSCRCQQKQNQPSLCVVFFGRCRNQPLLLRTP